MRDTIIRASIVLLSIVVSVLVTNLYRDMKAHEELQDLKIETLYQSRITLGSLFGS